MNKKLDFGIFSNEKQKSESPYISIDSQGRIYMNSDTQKRFNITKSQPTDIQVGHVDGTIYLIRFDSEHADKEKKPFRFSGDRAYASAKTFIEQAGIYPQEPKKSQKYFLDESFNEYAGVFAFVHEDILAERIHRKAAEVLSKTEAPAAPKEEKQQSTRGRGNRKQQAEAAAKAKAEAKQNA
ncbi:TPA: hypothetical protein ACLBZX_005111 [Bacillus cereus]|uniref:hypothetical protein n=1 Tax=Bacillus cereus group TaxID=86661 RepID=UPI000BA24404|nr:hypothetical protein [Bacillus thuringiensis]